VTVQLQDEFNNPVPSASDPVSVALAGKTAGGATLGGTTTEPAANGNAVFSDLSVNKAGTGYTLVAKDAQLGVQAIGLSIAGVKGNEIAVSSFALEASRAPGAGPSISDLILTLPFTAADPGVLAALSQPTHFPTVTLHVRNAAGREYLTYTLADATFTSQSAGSSGLTPTERLTIHFGRLTEAYRPPAPSGQLGQPVVVIYDAVSGTVIKGPNKVTPPANSSLLRIGLSVIPTTGKKATAGEIPITSFSQDASFAGGPLPSIGDLSLGLASSVADPGLLAALGRGQHLGGVILHVRNDTGREYLTYTLSDVTFTDLSTSGSGDTPTEALKVHFGQLTEVYRPIGPDGVPGPLPKFTYDATVGKVTTGADITGLPVGSPHPQLGLSFADATGDEIPINSYSEQADRAPSNFATFTDIQLSLSSSAADVGLLTALARGKHLENVVLHVRNTAGQEYLTYTLSDVTIPSLFTVGDGFSQTTSLTIHFGQVSESYRPVGPDGVLGTALVFTYDIAQAKVKDSAKVTVPPAGSPPPQVGLSLSGSKGGEIPIDSFSVGATASPGARPSISDLNLSLSGSATDPGLLTDLAQRRPLDSVILHVRNAAGQEYLTYTLADATFTSLFFEGTVSGQSDMLQIHFRELTEAYRPTDAKGMLGQPVQVTYDAVNGTVTSSAAIVGPPTDAQPPRIGLSVTGASGGEIPVDSLSEGVSASSSGALSFGDFSLSLAASAANPGLLTELVTGLATGGQPATVTVHVRNAAGQEYLTYTLEDATFTSLFTGGSAGGQSDLLQVRFGPFSEVYQPTDSSGKLGKALHFTYIPGKDVQGANFVGPPVGSPPPRLGLSIPGAAGSEIPLEALAGGVVASPGGLPSFSDFTLSLASSAADVGLLTEVAAPLQSHFHFPVRRWGRRQPERFSPGPLRPDTRSGSTCKSRRRAGESANLHLRPRQSCGPRSHPRHRCSAHRLP
jgi:type VI protein secretion system component Hcp